MRKKLAIPHQLSLNPIYSLVWNRVWNKDLNFSICFVGSPGSGKSFAAMSFLWNVCRNPTGESIFENKHIVFNAKDFIDTIKSPEMTKGHGILWDEPGVEAGAKARTSMSFKNRAISDVVQTCRERNLITAYALPSASLLDKNIRQLFNACVQMIYPSIGLYRWWEYDPVVGYTYKKMPTIVLPNGMITKRPRMWFPIPPKQLYSKYLIEKRESTDQWYADYSGRLGTEAKEREAPGTKLTKVYEEIKKDWENYWLPSGKSVNFANLRIKFPQLSAGELSAVGGVVKNFAYEILGEQKEKNKSEKEQKKEQKKKDKMQKVPSDLEKYYDDYLQ